MSRYAQSPSSFYPSFSQQRASSGKSLRNKIYSTAQSFYPINFISNYRPQSSAMFRSSSSSFRNTKGKLETLNDRLAFLLEDIKHTRTSFKELKLVLNLMKEDLIQHRIEPMKASLVQQVKKLEKAIQIKKRSDLLKFQALHETCYALSKNSMQIKSRLVEVDEHLYKIENMLGYHGLRDRLRY